jgi:eukaryotic-like serine/threonine-protein kinase
MTLNEGQLLHGRYRIEHLVARGGYGAVYKAFDTTLNRICAVKENLALGLQAERQFEQEAQLLARLHHPNLPRVIDHFLLPERGQYLVMDYVEGRNLQEILRHRLRPFGQDEALAVMRQVCMALTYLHNHSPPIVHRDVKPQNIIVTPGGPAVLVDFGVSKVVYGEGETVAGMRGVSPGYAAPEQYGTAPTDERSDVYSVGATLYTLLTGQPPVDSLQRLTGQVVLSPIHRCNGSVSPAVEQAVYMAMEPSLNLRLPSVARLQDALDAAQRASTRARSRHRSSWPVALVAGGGALAIILWTGILRGTPGNTLFVAGAGQDSAPLTAQAEATNVTQPFAQLPTQVAEAVPTQAPTQAPAQVPTPLPALPPVATATPEPPTTPPPTATPASIATPLPAPFATPFGGGGVIVFDGEQDGSRDIFSMAPDGSNVVDLTNNPADDWIGSLSPDDRWLLFSSNRAGNWDIFAQDLERGLLSRLTDDPAEDHDPAWSPDGERILFHSNRSDGVWRLYTMAPNGSDVRVLTHDPRGSWAGAWSPDGSKIAFSANFAQPGDIYLMNADGSNVVNLTNSTAHESAAHWSPDGAHIAFYSDRDGNREIYMMDADGSNPVRLTHDQAADISPTWSPDGNHIVFTSDRQGNMELYRMHVATGSVTQLSSGAVTEGSPSWAPGR